LAYVVKELRDNVIDRCESPRSPIPPHLTIEIDDHAIAVQDNGPGLDPDVVRRIRDLHQEHVEPRRLASRRAHWRRCES
jgi:DNA topoisomerase VI subunit B